MYDHSRAYDVQLEPAFIAHRTVSYPHFAGDFSQPYDRHSTLKSPIPSLFYRIWSPKKHPHLLPLLCK
jgi:hypothetical protein